jgi:hypothetical protein
MADTPLTPPAAAMAPIAALGQGDGKERFARRFAKRQAQLRAEDDAEPHELPASIIAADPTQALIEGLDRLRVTNLVRPADAEFTTALRAMKAYRKATDRIERES